RIIPLLKEVNDLLVERYNFTKFYRYDSWWHNCYKIKVNQGVIEDNYHVVLDEEIDTTDSREIRLRIWENNGGLTYTTPVFID
ncbi:MAG: hypothetical protein ACI4WM_08390, partial [Erysipelotrichaceae bacterium]